jgi:hypothetical protein
MNPYESPQLRIAPGYYWMNLAAARWREIRRALKGSRSLLVQALMAKCLGRRFISQGLRVGLDSYVRIDELPELAQTLLKEDLIRWHELEIEAVTACEAFNLSNQLWWTVHGVDRERLVLATLTVAWWRSPQGATTGQTGYALGSRLQSGMRLLTCNFTAWSDMPEWIDEVFVESQDQAEIYAVHLERLERRGRNQFVPYERLDLQATVRHFQLQQAEYKLQRGLLIPMTDREVEEVLKMVAKNRPA